jgi:hypothetical protein
MSGLSLMQTRSFIDKLGDLDNEITKVCRASEVIAKAAGKDSASGVGRLKEACDALKEKQTFLREAKEHLLAFDGFLHAESGTMRDAMSHPKIGAVFGQIGDRMGPMMEVHVGTIAEEVTDGIRRVTSAVKALRDSKEDKKRAGSLKQSAKALEKVCSAVEKAIGKAVKMSNKASIPEHGYEHMHAAEPEVQEVVEEEAVVDKAAGDIGFHGYSLTAGLPPEFLENAQKKKDEAAGKKNDDKDDKDDDKKKAHGYDLTAGLPPEFLENAQKKKDEAAGKKDDKDDDDKGDKKAGMPDFIKEKIEERSGDKKDDKDDDDKEKESCKKADSLVPGNESKGPKELGEEDQGWVPGHRTTQKPDDEKEGGKKATNGVTINVTVAGGDPSKVAETIASALRQADSKDPDPSMDDDLPGEDSDGEPVVGKSAHGYQLTDPPPPAPDTSHGYQLTNPADHGYDLTV